MKTTHLKKQLWLIALLAGSSLYGHAEELDSSKKKEINQSFTAGKDEQLTIDNRYGTITVTHWSKNEVDIRVVVEAKAGNDKRAQEALDRVQIELGKSGHTISGHTRLQGSLNAGNNRITIDYFIRMPSKLALTLSQRYGNINLPEKNEGKCEIEVKYGNFKAGSFSKELRINASYSNIQIEEAEDVDMEVRYGGNVRTGDIRKLSADSRYSNLKLGNVDKLRIDSHYGSLKVQKIRSATIELKYCDASIERIEEELILSTLDYSALKIQEVSDRFKRIDASARYGTLRLSISPKASFRLTAEDMKYGKVEIKGLKITEESIENKRNYYYRINGGNSSHIRFEGNNYSNLKINAL
jgi:hypothetical protein